MSSAATEDPKRGKKMALWLVILVLGLGGVAWALNRPQPVEEIDPADRQMPSMEEIEEGEVIEERTSGPLDRPPGTAPADMRRPASAPYEQPRQRPATDEPHDRPPGVGPDRLMPPEVPPPGEDDDDPAPLDDEEAEPSSQSSQTPENIQAGRVRRVPPHLLEDEDERPLRPEDEDRAQDEADELQALEDQDWEQDPGSPPMEEEFSMDEGDQQRGEFDEYYDDEYYDEGGEEFAEFLDEEEGDVDGESTVSEEVVAEEAVPEEEAFTGTDSAPTAGAAGGQTGAAVANGNDPGSAAAGAAQGESEQSDQLEGGAEDLALDAVHDYREFLDEAGVPEAGEVGMYSSMATNHLADVLYLMSAGTLLPQEEASRQHDDLVEAAEPRATDPGTTEPVEDTSEGIDGELEDLRDLLDGELEEGWTAWLDAADWLRFIQEENYPELEGLVDEVEEAAAAIDPEQPREEQIEELMRFFESVEVVLDAITEIESGPRS